MKAGLAIYHILYNDSNVSSTVGDRIYPELAPEGATTPYIVYSIVGNTPVDTKEETVIDEASIELFCVNNKYKNCMTMADDVRSAMDRAQHTSTAAGLEIDVQSIIYTNEVTEVNQDRNTYVAIQDYTMRIKK